MSSSSNTNNLKSYYNSSSYQEGNDVSSSTPQPKVVHKPDEITSISTSDLMPPPPYSPNPSASAATVTRNSTSSYGSVNRNRDSFDLEGQQQQQSLLSNTTTSRGQSASHNHSHEEQTSSTTSAAPSSDFASFNKKSSKKLFKSIRNRNSNNISHCRAWCKYIFAAILMSVVVYKYSDQLFPGVTPAKPRPSPPVVVPPPQGPSYCSDTDNKNCITWQDMPSSIDFDSIKNLELVVEHTTTSNRAYLSEEEGDDTDYVQQQGHLIITPVEDRHRGTILSDIKIYPSALDLSYDLSYPSGDTLRLYIQVPTYFRLKKRSLYEQRQQRPCVNIQLELRLPYDMDNVHVKLTNMNIDVVRPFVKDNMEILDLETSNGHIVLDGGWGGKSKLNLMTSNGDIEVNGNKVISDGEVYIETSNGLVRLTQDVIAKRRIQIANSNGDMEAVASVLRADDEVMLKTSNAAVKVSHVMADRITIENANGLVSIDRAGAKEEVVVTTSNGPISLSVYETKNNRVTAITSNDKIDLRMPTEFEGSFSMSTSFGDVRIENEQDITFQDDLDYLKRGVRRGYGNKGDLTAQTSNGDIDVAFNV